jgi:Protein of unknown function (DUF3309)
LKSLPQILAVDHFDRRSRGVEVIEQARIHADATRYAVNGIGRFSVQFDPANGARLMSLGTILVIILIIFLLGGFSGRFGGYGYGFGHGGVGVLGTILIIVVILVLLGRI